jgi:DNA end-binding protein Ku
MRFAEELRTPRSVGLPEVELDARKLKSMRALVGKHKLRGEPSQLLAKHDDHEQKLEALVKKKQKQKDAVVHIEPRGGDEGSGQLADVIDLVAILKQSLGQGGGKPTETPAAKKAAKRAPAKKKRAAHGR